MNSSESKKEPTLRNRNSNTLTEIGQRKLKEAILKFLEKENKLKIDDKKLMIYDEEKDKFVLARLIKLLQLYKLFIDAGTLKNILTTCAPSDKVTEVFKFFGLELDEGDIQKKLQVSEPEAMANKVIERNSKPLYCKSNGSSYLCEFCNNSDNSFFQNVKEFILEDRLDCGVWSRKFNTSYYRNSESVQEENFFCTYQAIRALKECGYSITARDEIGQELVSFFKEHQRKAGGIGCKVSGRGARQIILPSQRRTAYAVMVLEMIQGDIHILKKGLSFLGRSILEDLEDDDGAPSMAITAFLLTYHKLINSDWVRSTLSNDELETYKRNWGSNLYASAHTYLITDARSHMYELWEPFAKSEKLEIPTNLSTVDFLLELSKYPEIDNQYPVSEIISTLSLIAKSQGHLDGYTALLSYEKQGLDIGTSSYFAYLCSNPIIWQSGSSEVKNIIELGDCCFEYVVNATKDDNWTEMDFLTEMLAPVLLLKGCPWRTRQAHLASSHVSR